MQVLIIHGETGIEAAQPGGFEPFGKKTTAAKRNK
jgi:hypothetical protein